MKTECPKCRDLDIRPARFRWWHLPLAAFLLRRWKCRHCRRYFLRFVWAR